MKLLTGNDLKTGDVIWWTGNGWSLRVEDAVDVGENGEPILRAEAGAQRVNDPNIIDADEQGLPLHIKDRVRAAGPSVRKDLGINPALPLVKA